MKCLVLMFVYLQHDPLWFLQKPQPPSGSSSLKWEKYWWENKRILISASPPQLSYNSAVASSCRADCCDGMLHPSPFISTTIRDKLLVAPSDLISPRTLLFSFFSPKLFSTCASISKVLHSTSLSSPLFSPSAVKSQSEARKAASLSSLDFSAAVSLLYCSVLFSPALMSHTHTERRNPVSKTLRSNLVTSGYCKVFAHLKSQGWTPVVLAPHHFCPPSLSVSLLHHPFRVLHWKWKVSIMLNVKMLYNKETAEFGITPQSASRQPELSASEAGKG